MKMHDQNDALSDTPKQLVKIIENKDSRAFGVSDSASF